MKRIATGLLSRIIATSFTVTAMADTSNIDLNTLWDFSQPALSEQRFRDAMVTASDDQRLILHTQIARSHGLRRDFAKARELLNVIAPQVTGPQASASAQAQARWWLEWGRSYASATHKQAALTDDDRRTAIQAFERAATIAQAAALDALTIDALHMLPFALTDTSQQQAATERALALSLQSTQTEARRWEGALRNNLGYAAHQRGDYGQALQQFRA